jgi:hypothetical protein
MKTAKVQLELEIQDLGQSIANSPYLFDRPTSVSHRRIPCPSSSAETFLQGPQP